MFEEVDQETCAPIQWLFRTRRRRRNPEAVIQYQDLVRHLKRMRDETRQGIWIISAVMHIPTPGGSKVRKCELLKR